MTRPCGVVVQGDMQGTQTRGSPGGEQNRVSRRQYMLKIKSAAAAAIALLVTAVVSVPANAIMTGTPAGLQVAIDDIAVIDQVHCRPHRLHHRWRFGHPTWDGCHRRGLIWFG